MQPSQNPAPDDAPAVGPQECSGPPAKHPANSGKQTEDLFTVRDLIEIVTIPEVRGVGVKSLTNGIVDTTTAHGELVFGIFALMAGYEATLIQEWIMVGLAAARAPSRTGGPRPKMTPELTGRAQRTYDAKTFTMAEIAARHEQPRHRMLTAHRVSQLTAQSQHPGPGHVAGPVGLPRRQPGARSKFCAGPLLLAGRAGGLTERAAW